MKLEESTGERGFNFSRSFKILLVYLTGFLKELLSHPSNHLVRLCVRKHHIPGSLMLPYHNEMSPKHPQVGRQWDDVVVQPL